MKRRTLLFVMNSKTTDAEIASVAEAAAREEAHLNCLMINPAPALPMYAYGVPPYGGMNIPDNWSETVTSSQEAQKARVDGVEQILARAGTSGDVVGVLSVTTDVKHHVARVACVSDEAIFAANLRDTPEFMREAASGILFHSPIGFLLNGSDMKTYNRIFVAWDGSQAASAAVHAALPHLKAATEVTIGCIDPVATADRDGQNPGTDVAAWLSHHGCTLTISQLPSGGRPIGTCIQDRAGEIGADLVVMGAYGHSRMIQAVLGGTTRSMVEQTDFAVLLAN